MLQDFAKLQLEEISMNISARRNKIFLLMEEVRRLRIQQRIKGGERTREEEVQFFMYILPMKTVHDSLYCHWQGQDVSLSVLHNTLMADSAVRSPLILRTHRGTLFCMSTLRPSDRDLHFCVHRSERRSFPVRCHFCLLSRMRP